MHRSSSRRNKENGSRAASIRAAKQNQNALIEQASGSGVSGAISKRTKTRVVSFEQAATTSDTNNTDATTTTTTTAAATTTSSAAAPKVCYFDHSKSVDQAVIVERRTEFNNSLSVDNDLLVHDWPMTILPTAKSDVTPSKPPRI